MTITPLKCKLRGKRKHPSVASAATDTHHKAKTGNVQLKMWDIMCTPTIFVYSPNLDDLHINKTHCPGVVKTNLIGMPMDSGKTIKLKWGEIKARFRGDLTATVRKDRM